MKSTIMNIGSVFIILVAFVFLNSCDSDNNVCNELNKDIDFHGVFLFSSNISVGKYEREASGTDTLKEYMLLGHVIRNYDDRTWIDGGQLTICNVKIDPVSFFDKTEYGYHIPVSTDSLNGLPVFGKKAFFGLEGNQDNSIQGFLHEYYVPDHIEIINKDFPNHQISKKHDDYELLWNTDDGDNCNTYVFLEIYESEKNAGVIKRFGEVIEDNGKFLINTNDFEVGSEIYISLRRTKDIVAEQNERNYKFTIISWVENYYNVVK